MKILIPTDFSENAKKALNYAIVCFPKASFTLLHITYIYQAGATMVVDVNLELKELGEKKMESYIEELKKEYPDIKINGKVDMGYFSETIVEAIEEEHYDLIAMGTKGASGMKEILIGSNAADAIKNINRSMIVVPHQVKIKKPKRILLSSDFTSESLKLEYQIIDDLREKFNAEIELLHVFTNNERLEDISYSDLMEKKEVDIHVLENDNIEDTILQFAHENKFDMIALAPKHRGFIKNIFHHSVTKKLSMHTDIPLFIWK
jgi:nucleotide-binding universal stress UspA family protein